MVFPGVMYGCESWTIKKVARLRIDAFELWLWRRFLRVPWTARTSSQSILKEITAEYSLEGLMLKLQYFGHLESVDSLKNTLMLGNWRQEEKGMTEDGMVGWHHRLDGHEFKQTQGDGEGQESLACCSPWGCKESDKAEWLNWSLRVARLLLRQLDFPRVCALSYLGGNENFLWPRLKFSAHHFYHSLLIKQITKATPDSRTGGLVPIFPLKDCKRICSHL